MVYMARACTERTHCYGNRLLGRGASARVDFDLAHGAGQNFNCNFERTAAERKQLRPEVRHACTIPTIYTFAVKMGDEEGGEAPYSWTSQEPLQEGVEEPPTGKYVQSAGR